MHRTILHTILISLSPLLGSGPKGVDDLCFHTFGEFSPSPSPPPPPSSTSPPLWLRFLPQGPNPSLEAQIPALAPKSQSGGFKDRILASRSTFCPKDCIWTNKGVELTEKRDLNSLAPSVRLDSFFVSDCLPTIRRHIMQEFRFSCMFVWVCV